MRGARAVQEALVVGFPQADVSISIVWIDMLESDGAQMARVSAQIVEGARVRHFHDPERRVGRAIAGSIGGQGQIAWDIYLFYARGSKWSDGPPAPTDWAHQLSADWIDPARFRWGGDLDRELDKVMGRLMDDAL